VRSNARLNHGEASSGPAPHSMAARRIRHNPEVGAIAMAHGSTTGAGLTAGHDRPILLPRRGDRSGADRCDELRPRQGVTSHWSPLSVRITSY
jgi:hypothetical protein